MGANTSHILAQNLPTSNKVVYELQNHANTCAKKGQYQKAIDCYKTAIIKVIELPDIDKKTCVFLGHDLAMIYLKQNKYKLALSYLQKALAISLQLEESDVAITQKMWSKMGLVNMYQGFYSEAEMCYNNMLIASRLVGGDESVCVAKALEDFSLLYTKQARHQKALNALKKALKIKLQKLGDNHDSIADTYTRVGQVYHDQKEYCAALANYRKSLTIKKRELGKEHIETAHCFMNIANVCYECEEYEEALEHYNLALNIYKMMADEREDLLCPVYKGIALIYGRTGRFVDSWRLLEDAQKVCLKRVGKTHLIMADIYEAIGTVFGFKNNHEKTKFYLQKALVIKKKILGEEHPLIASSYEKLGSNYKQMNKYQRALDFHQKAMTIRIDKLSENHSSVADSYWEVGLLYIELRDIDKAKETLQTCLKSYIKCYGRANPVYKKVLTKLEEIEKVVPSVGIGKSRKPTAEATDHTSLDNSSIDLSLKIY